MLFGVHHRLLLAEFRLGSVEVGAVALGVDERVRRVLRGLARDELAVPAPRSRARGHPDVGREAPQHAEAALAAVRVGLPDPEQERGEDGGQSEQKPKHCQEVESGL